MEYKYVVMERKFRFGAEEEIKNIEEARKGAKKLKEVFLTGIQYGALWKNLNYKIEEGYNCVKLIITIRCSEDLFE